MTLPSNLRVLISLTAVLLLGAASALFYTLTSWRNSSESARRLSRKPMVHREPLILDDLLVATETRVVPGESHELPYGLQVVMQTRSPIEPVAFVVETDRDIGSGHAIQFNGGEYLLYKRTKQGIPLNHPNWFAFEWETPAFTPNAPIIVSLSSKTPITLARLYKVGYEWP